MGGTWLIQWRTSKCQCVCVESVPVGQSVPAKRNSPTPAGKVVGVTVDVRVLSVRGEKVGDFVVQRSTFN